MSTDPQHPMGVVTRRTGLRADLIRSWERRHNAIVPSRSAGNRRLYSDADIRRLQLIRQAVNAGWQIGQVASLDDSAIQRLVEEQAPANGEAEARFEESSPTDRFLSRSLEAIADLDGDGFERQLQAASVELGRIELLERLIVPLVESIGTACAGGALRTAHEHLATVVLRSFLDSLRAAYTATDSSPGIVVTTPAYQHHELAAILVAATARSEGWRTIYLGPNLPAEEIAAAAVRRDARTVALSITFPGDDPRLDGELRKLRRLLSDDTEIIVGGRSAAGYDTVFREIGARRVDTLAAFRAYLAETRSSVRRASRAGVS